MIAYARRLHNAHVIGVDATLAVKAMARRIEILLQGMQASRLVNLDTVTANEI